MFDFRACTELHLMLILSLQDILQNLSLEMTLIDNVVPCYPHDNIGGDHLCGECKEIIRATRLSQACVQRVTDLASVLTDHRMSGRPIRARYKHFKTI